MSESNLLERIAARAAQRGESISREIVANYDDLMRGVGDVTRRTPMGRVANALIALGFGEKKDPYAGRTTVSKAPFGMHSGDPGDVVAAAALDPANFAGGLGTMIPAAKFMYGKPGMRVLAPLKTAINKDPSLIKDLEKMQELRAKEYPPSEIGAETGFYETPDMRSNTVYYNFPESVDDLIPGGVEKLANEKKVLMKEIVNNPMLLNSVPYLSRIPIELKTKRQTPGYRGSYTGRQDIIDQARMEVRDDLLKDLPALRGVLSHETTHHGQELYSASGGYSENIGKNNIKDLHERYPLVVAALLKQGVSDPFYLAEKLLESRALPSSNAGWSPDLMAQTMDFMKHPAPVIQESIRLMAKRPREQLVELLAAGANKLDPAHDYWRTIGEGTARFSQVPYEFPNLHKAVRPTSHLPLNVTTMNMPIGVNDLDYMAETPVKRIMDPTSILLAEDYDEIGKWLNRIVGKASRNQP